MLHSQARRAASTPSGTAVRSPTGPETAATAIPVVEVLNPAWAKDANGNTVETHYEIII